MNLLHRIAQSRWDAAARAVARIDKAIDDAGRAARTCDARVAVWVATRVQQIADTMHGAKP